MPMSRSWREPDIEGGELDGEVPWAQLESLHLESFGWARSCCGQDAEEAENVLQAVYLKICEGRAVFDGRSALRTWLFAVIRKTAAEGRRRRFVHRLGLGGGGEGGAGAGGPTRPGAGGH